MYEPQPRSWRKKFADATVGVWLGVRGQSSFAVHIGVAILVGIAAAVMGVSLTGWCLLVLCIGLVTTAELLNSALEALAKAVDVEENDHLRDALNIASGAVLISAITAAIVGAVVFISRFIELIAD